MFQVRTFTVARDDRQVVQGPFLRVVVDGQGCPCGCSPSNYLTLSDGRTLLTVALTDAEAAAIRGEGRLEVLGPSEEPSP